LRSHASNTRVPINVQNCHVAMSLSQHLQHFMRIELLLALYLALRGGIEEVSARLVRIDVGVQQV
jgi:hypothetical protein